jgi:Helix-turn-helix domain
MAAITKQVIDSLEYIKEQIKNLTDKQDQGDVITYEHAMELLECSRQFLDSLRADGKLKVYRFASKRKLYVKRSEIMDLMEHVA